MPLVATIVAVASGGESRDGDLLDHIADARAVIEETPTSSTMPPNNEPATPLPRRPAPRPDRNEHTAAPVEPEQHTTSNVDARPAREGSARWIRFTTFALLAVAAIAVVLPLRDHGRPLNRLRRPSPPTHADRGDDADQGVVDADRQRQVGPRSQVGAPPARPAHRSAPVPTTDAPNARESQRAEPTIVERRDSDDRSVDPSANSGGPAIQPGELGNLDSNVAVHTVAATRPAHVDDRATPKVMLTVCGRSVGVIGSPAPQAMPVVFVLAAAGRALHASELCDVTGYAPKSLSTVFTTDHPLVERDAGVLRLRDHVWTDHRWTSECVRRLAAAIQTALDSPDTFRWAHDGFAALRSLQRAPYAEVPNGRKRTRATAAWGWVDEFPADVPARAEAETDVAEAALAFSELWLATPSTPVRADDLVAELCRLAGLVPYANVARQVRPSPWVTGAECLLAMAAQVAGDDERARNGVQQTARAMAARDQIVPSDDLADMLDL